MIFLEVTGLPLQVGQVPAEINGMLSRATTDFKNVVCFRELVSQNTQYR
jgi:hypothetical protein